ncbi:MAG: DNA polymerase III subunit beta [Lewinellaceae bacterium]|nr:DNA polymerase III subunit beta [Saprospiraceae bacterium]MCB9338064.1 DNA polymerase III subunit beta [Lewinellaceae bacterium]
MKFSVSSSELLKQLQVASGAISTSPVLPILDDFLFSIKKNQLTIAATDLETSITNKLEVMSDGDGTVAIPAKILLDTLKALPEQPITIAVEDETFGITITSAYGKYRLAGENGQDYPRIPESDKVDTVNVPASTLTKAINKTLFATSNDELRPAMTGVYVSLDFNKLTFVSTDAHKLVRYSFMNLSSEVATSFIIPKKALNLLKNALPQNGDVKMSFDKANAFFTFDDTHLVCRLIDARYPDYNAVIPVDNPNTLTIRRTDLQSSLKRIAIYANKTTNQVILDISPDSLTVSAQDLDFSNEAAEQLSCTYEGNPVTIGFNAKFLIEMLGVLESDEVKMELSTPSRAGILLPGEGEDGEEILMLVMPVMLSN